VAEGKDPARYRIASQNRFVRGLLEVQSATIKAKVKKHIEDDFAERQALQMDPLVDPAEYTPGQLQE